MLRCFRKKSTLHVYSTSMPHDMKTKSSDNIYNSFRNTPFYFMEPHITFRKCCCFSVFGFFDTTFERFYCLALNKKFKNFAHI